MLRRVFAILLASAAFVAPLCAQEETTITLPANGPDFFSHILHSEGLLSLKSFQEAEDDPFDSMIIILGAPKGKDVARFTRDGLKPFLDGGGTLFVATDRPLTLGKPLRITVTESRIEVPAALGYRGNRFCPWLEYTVPIVEGPRGPEAVLRDVREHPIFHLLQQGIATNCPSHINFDNPEPPVARLLLFPLRRGPYGEKPPKTYVAGSPKDARPEGRVLLVAGYGTFMNSMMLQKDNDNFAFALNCVRWLREKSDGTKRQSALFVVDGEIITNFDRNLTPPLPPIPIPPATTVNRLLRGLEDEGVFHKALGGLLGDSYSRVVPILIGLATCVLLLYGGKKFMEGRYQRENAVPRMVGAQPGVSAPPRGEQRLQALLRGSDPWAEARTLIEQWLQNAFGVTPEDWAAAGGAAEFRAAGFLGSGWGMQRRADRVLELLRAAGPTKVSRREFALLVESLPELDRAVREGRLALLLDGKEVRQTSIK